ncbi:VWA domain-containing protein [Phycisphaeraceae bacterium AH-315-B13]|nr:VWA domain-containing protein [Phycisphaeraceae bacterium AH-315-B13]PHQ79306.1 MAG: hypothetical protein COB69_08225 [Phycisphaera sp.]
MTLLDPASAIVAGAIAAPLLVMLYFLKLRRRRLRIGSTLLWQRAVKDLQVNEPFRWLKPSLLLFLQLLALACLTIALGRPTIPGGAASGDRVIILLDRSASMNALDGPAGTSRFDEAIQTARDIIVDLGSGASINIIAFASQPEVRFAPSTNRAAALRALDQINPTDQPGDIKSVLQLTQNLLKSEVNEQDSTEPATVILISDGGLNRSNLSLAGGTIQFRRAGPPHSASYDNLGITHLNISADFDDPALTRLFIRLENAASRDIATTVTLTGSSGLIDRKPIRIPAASATGPGTQTLTFELDRGETGLITATIDRDDLLQADNSVSAIVSPASLPNIVLVTPDNDDGSLDWVIRNTLEEMNLAKLTTRNASEFFEQLQSEQLSRADLVLFDRVDVPTGVPAPSISFAADLPSIQVQLEDTKPDRFTAWSRSNPIMQRLVLDSVRMSQRAWFDTAGTDLVIDELASGRRGPNIVLLTESGHRRLGVAFEPARSNWPLDIAFPLFLIQAIENFTLESHASADMFSTTHSNATIQLTGGSGKLELTGPAEISVQIPPAESDQPRRVSLGIPERAGVYTDSLGNPVLAVNVLESSESSLATADTIRIAGRSVRTGQTTQGRREVWHWFVIAATVVLTAEWLIFARRMRA